MRLVLHSLLLFVHLVPVMIIIIDLFARSNRLHIESFVEQAPCDLDILTLVGHNEYIVDQQAVKLKIWHDGEQITKGARCLDDGPAEAETASLDLEVLDLLAQALHIIIAPPPVNYANHYTL